jgi:hypothetical protein
MKRKGLGKQRTGQGLVGQYLYIVVCHLQARLTITILSPGDAEKDSESLSAHYQPWLVGSGAPMIWIPSISTQRPRQRFLGSEHGC